MGKKPARILDDVASAPGGGFLAQVSWRLRTDRLGALLLVIEVLALLGWLPPLPKLRSAERIRARVDGKMLERVRALLAKAESTTFLCQATAAMAAAGSLNAGPYARRARTRSFRRSFLVAYATRIGFRLRAATDAATQDAVEVHGRERLLPVLAARAAAADAAVKEAFPHMTRKGFSAHDAAGWAAGAAAADLASLSTSPAVEQTAG